MKMSYFAAAALAASTMASPAGAAIINLSVHIDVADDINYFEGTFDDFHYYAVGDFDFVFDDALSITPTSTGVTSSSLVGYFVSGTK